MTNECIKRVESIADNEITKLVTHMETTEADDADICRLYKLVKIKHVLSLMKA